MLPSNLDIAKMTEKNTLNSITIYTTNYCPYCVKAKRLLEQKGLSYLEINIENDLKLREEMVAKASGKKTVPQIFIGNLYIGGCDDLHELEKQGKLDELIKIK